MKYMQLGDLQRVFRVESHSKSWQVQQRKEKLNALELAIESLMSDRSITILTLSMVRKRAAEMNIYSQMTGKGYTLAIEIMLDNLCKEGQLKKSQRNKTPYYDIVRVNSVKS